MSKKPMSTYDREMQDPEFKAAYEKEFKEFALSELLLAMMEEDDVSVRKLARAVNVSPSVIQKLRSGKQKDIKLTNFMSIAKEFGYILVLEKGDSRICLNDQ
jgi:DNA-binding Xre family transcriptional regulator